MVLVDLDRNTVRVPEKKLRRQDSLYELHGKITGQTMAHTTLMPASMLKVRILPLRARAEWWRCLTANRSSSGSFRTTC